MHQNPFTFAHPVGPFAFANLGAFLAAYTFLPRGLVGSGSSAGVVPLSQGGTGANLSDPNADRILFWDDSAGAVTWLTAPSPFGISGTNLVLSLSTSDLPNFNGFSTVDPELEDYVLGLEVDGLTNKKFAANALLGLVPIVPCGRLTLSSTVSVTTTDTTNTSVWYIPHSGFTVPLYDGTRWILVPLGFPTVALGTVTAGNVYDIFAYYDSGGVAIEKLAWTNPTTRATALALTGAYLVKSGDPTRLYVGTIQAATTTTIADGVAERGVWNMYHRVQRSMYVHEAANNWNYNSTTLRALNNSNANRVKFVRGLDEDAMTAMAILNVNDASSTGATVSIGLDSITTSATGVLLGATFNAASAGTVIPAVARWSGPTGVGSHFLQALEAARTGNPSLIGDGNTPTLVQSGIQAEGWF